MPALGQKRGAMNRRPPREERPLEKLQRMSPEQRHKALEKLPPARRQAIEQRLSQYSRLSPDEKARFDKFRDLPPERQDAVRQAIGSLTNLPPERQQAVRQELRHLRGLSDGDRETHLKSTEFRERLDSGEQKLIQELRDVVPHLARLSRTIHSMGRVK